MSGRACRLEEKHHKWKPTGIIAKRLEAYTIFWRQDKISGPGLRLGSWHPRTGIQTPEKYGSRYKAYI